MKSVLLIFYLFVCVSCKYFSTEKITVEEWVQEETQTINWNDIDTYPLFPGCDELQSKAAQKSCFETTLKDHLSQFLRSKEIISNTVINEQVHLEIVISKEGQVYSEKMVADSLVRVEIPELENWLSESLLTLPKIEPALKRGIPVTTRFVLPVVIQSE